MSEALPSGSEDAADRHRRAATDDKVATRDLVVRPPHLVEMTDEQQREAIRLLVGLLDARLARRWASRHGHGDPLSPDRGVLDS